VPDLRGIQALIDATSAAGTPTTLRADGDVVSLPPPVALAAYRIVQESLTNVVRHAGPAAATVTLVHEDGHLVVDVVNDGAAGPRAPFGDGAGTGLAGMRERAAALGGTLEAGARPGGGFRVHAKLPTSAAQTEPVSAEPAGAEPVGAEPEAAGEVRSESRVSRP
jgi:signal transduction histidine kinase